MISIIIKLFKILLPADKIIFLNQLYELSGWMRAMEKNLQNLALATQTTNKSTNKKEYLRLRELKIHSQFGEDGILLYIFSKIGTVDRTFVEIGGGDGKECLTANLSINFGWSGLIIDGNKSNMDFAKKYYQNMIPDSSFKVKTICEYVTKDNVNKILKKYQFTGEVDLLTIDVDGIDYWLWQAVDIIQPRVVVVEYNASLGKELSCVVKYNNSIDRYSGSKQGYYHSASLQAFAKLAKNKGYYLVGCESHGVNAFFVRKDIGQGRLPSMSVKEAFYSHALRLQTLSQEEQIKESKKLNFLTA